MLRSLFPASILIRRAGRPLLNKLYYKFKGFPLKMFLFGVLFFCFGALNCQGAQEVDKPGPTVQKEIVPLITKQVVFVIINGLQADSLTRYNAPNINGLGMAGVRAEKVSVMPPDDDASQIFSVISGADPWLHGVLSAGVKPSRESLLNLLEKKGYKTALYDGTGKLKESINGVSYYHGGPYNGDRELMDAAILEMEAKKPYLSVIIIKGGNNGSGVTLSSGCNSAAGITEVDNLVGRLLNNLYQRGVFEETLIVITGTTGSPPLFIRGVDFKAGYVMPPVKNTDMAATIAYLNGIKAGTIPGFVLWDALVPGEGRQEKYMLQQRIQDLSRSMAVTLEHIGGIQGARQELYEEQQSLEREKMQVSNQIITRDKQIQRLNFIITMLKFGLALLVVFLMVALVYQYKILRKKFLFFD